MTDRERKWQIEAVNMAIARIMAREPTSELFEELIFLKKRKMLLMNSKSADSETQEKASTCNSNERPETD